MNIWREKTYVHFGEIDQSKRLTLSAIFGFFQEAAISHAANLGLGIDYLANNGKAWILSRLSIFADRRPLSGESIEIVSWPRQWEKLFALRDYEIRDEGGRAAVRGRACWLIIDTEKRRPLRIQPLVESLPPNEGIDAFPAGAPGLEKNESLVKKTERTALYSDIDYFGHVNNARYIQWIQDVTELDTLTRADQMRFDINYISEVKPGETIELWTASLDKSGLTDNGDSGGNTRKPAGGQKILNPADYPLKPGPAFAYEGIRAGTGQTVFRAELRL